MINSHWKHWTCGFPAHSGGHWHTARWYIALHWACSPQGLYGVWQGSWQKFSMQDLLSGHSESNWHSPTLTKKMKILLHQCAMWKSNHRLTWKTLLVGISSKTWSTRTLSLVVQSGADGQGTTWILASTWVDTCTIDASLCRWTHGVRSTANINRFSYEFGI